MELSKIWSFEPIATWHGNTLLKPNLMVVFARQENVKMCFSLSTITRLKIQVHDYWLSSSVCDTRSPRSAATILSKGRFEIFKTILRHRTWPWLLGKILIRFARLTWQQDYRAGELSFVAVRRCFISPFESVTFLLHSCVINICMIIQKWWNSMPSAYAK